MSEDVKLSTADLIFCSAMVRPGSTQTSAYLAAYPNFKGMVKTATEEGSRVASRPEIKAKIAELQQSVIVAPAIASAEECATILTLIARADIRKIVDGKWCVKPPGEIPSDHAIAIGGVKFDKDGQPEVKMLDRQIAARLLLEFHGKGASAPQPNDGETLEEVTSAYDWARRIAFTIQRGKQQRQQQLVEGSTDEH